MGGGSDSTSLYLSVIEMLLATYLSFILEFLGWIWDCSKRVLENNNSKIGALSRLKEKKASNSSVVRLARTCIGEVYKAK